MFPSLRSVFLGSLYLGLLMLFLGIVQTSFADTSNVHPCATSCECRKAGSCIKNNTADKPEPCQNADCICSLAGGGGYSCGDK